jgi:hypothetical protein
MNFEQRFDRWVQRHVDELVASSKVALPPVLFGIGALVIIGLITR